MKAIKKCEEEFDGVCVYDVSQSEVIHDFTYIIDLTPTVDAVPVTHGRWERIINPYGELEMYIHKECGFGSVCAYNYCPNCGTKMDLDEVEE